MKQPMLKPEGYILHKLQRMILLHLAENEPQTANETSIKIDKDYKPTSTAFKTLEKLNLITETKIKKYRNRKYSEFWLTDEGIVLAILEGANHEKMSKQAQKLHPDDKALHLFLDVAPYIDRQIIEMTYSSVKESGDLDFMDVMNVLFLQAPTEMDRENAKKLSVTLKKYPEEYKILKQAKKFIIKQLNQIIPD
jgi:hypothetical protein